MRPIKHTTPVIIPQVLRALRKAANSAHVVNIVYVDSKGATTTRSTEPYDIKDGKYWGFCLERMSIRQFSLGNITSAVVTDLKYTPRWPVNIL